MGKKGVVVGALIIVSSFLNAQNYHKLCGQAEAEKAFLDSHPELLEDFLEERRKKDEFALAFEKQQRGSRYEYDYVVPIVFHILHQGGTENISDEQIFDEVRNMNANFNLRNADTIDIVDDFKSVAGNARIQFRLARKDPDGTATTGIVRYMTTETDMADDNIKTSRAWPRDQYLNIYVVRTIGSGAAGYSYLPSNNLTETNDGIVILQNFVGTIGTSNYTRSKALTHEIGHWLDLPHPWGYDPSPGLSTNCNDDDGVSDTPNTIGYSMCDLGGTTCGSLDNVQNYMDYSYCSVMFTEGQVSRMRAALTSSTAGRNNLWSEANLVATGVSDLVEADFYSDAEIVCQGSYIHYTDESKYGTEEWQWTLDGGYPNSSTSSCPKVYYNTPGLYDVVLTAESGSQTKVKNKQGYVFVLDEIGKNVPYFEGFENHSSIPNDQWYISNPDNSLNKWELATNAAYSGNNSARMSNFLNNQESIDDLISETVDLSILDSASMTFKYAYTQNNGSGDFMRLSFSNDCGATWSLAWLNVGSAMATTTSQSSYFVPNGQSEWKEQIISTIPSSMLNEGFMYKFELESDSGNNFYVDDINISGTFKAYPVLQSPEDGSAFLSDSETIDWKAVPSVDEYEYQLDTDSTFSSSNLISGTKTYISTDPTGTDTEFETSNLLHGQTYYWRVRAITGGNPSDWSDIWSFTVSSTGVGIHEAQQKGLLDLRVIPNPMKGEGWVNFNLQDPTKVNMAVYNVLGEKVIDLGENIQTTGNHSIRLSTDNLKKGIYFVRLKTKETMESATLIVK